MHFQNNKKLSYAILVFMCLMQFSALGFNGTAQAETISDAPVSTSPCENSLAYTGDLAAPKDSFSIYIKLGKRGQSEPSSLFVKTNKTGCNKLGSIKASGNKWLKIGTWNNKYGELPNFVLDSRAITNLPDANRPTILLVSKTNSICAPKAEQCYTKLDGKKAYIVPTGTAFIDDPLRVLRVVNPKQDKIKKVDYFVDSEFAYTTKKLESFNKKYVPGGSHTITRVVKYESGQQVVYPEEVDQSAKGGFQNYIFSLFSQNKSWLQIASLTVFIILFVLVIVHLSHKLHSRRLKKLQHGIIQQSAFTPSAEAKTPVFSDVIVYTSKILPFILTIAIIIFVISINKSWGLKTVEVHGVSMRNTLQNTNKMLVSKFGKSWANFNKQEYVPKRGEVIIVRQADSSFLSPEEIADQKPSFFVKRVIGLPGERIKVKKGIVKVFNYEKPKGFNPDENMPWLKTMRKDTVDEDLDLTLSRNEIFVLGDNRPESVDSRFNGPVPTANIYGHVIARIGPIKEFKRL